jgi:subtilase family serine protease
VAGILQSDISSLSQEGTGGHSVTGRRLRRAGCAVLVAGALVTVGGAGASRPHSATTVTSTAACHATSPDLARCFARVVTDSPRGHAGNAASRARGLGPAELRSAYNLPATGGEGRTVAVVDSFDDPNAESDLAVYRSTYGLPACTTANGCFRKVDATGGGRLPAADADWAKEISLDLDMVSAACPACKVLLVEAGGQDIPSLGAAENVAAATPGVVAITNSWGVLESDKETGWDHFFNHPGIAVVVASGDLGYQPVFPAASPFVTAVGGTTLTRSSSSARGWDEAAWSGSGSGCSTIEPKPSWQHDPGCAHRAIADVSAVADPASGVAMYDTYGASGWVKAGGTSIGSPFIAGVYALAGNSGSVVAGSYPYGHSGALNPVVQGSNDFFCDSYLCQAGPGPGYNGPTGLGTPNGTGAF